MKQTRTGLLVLALAALLALALAAPAGAAKAQRKAQAAQPAPPKVTGIKVLEFGIYTSTVQSREKSPTIADGIKDRARDFKLVRKSTLVDARLGTSIGMKYVLRGAPKGASVPIEVAVRHPEMVNPETREAMTRSTATFERVIGQPEHAVWSFDTPEGLVPGEYVIELLFEGQVMVQKEFRVAVRR
ncbi:MAG: DUF3859 domain-containing protein [Proteobacteria bacterium]|nr:DUF3859 domain-containing protein [Pseudomonadota bacterium]MBU1595659.1 DUF3859 domain-containing protein [Pseudomonadota bacterium]